MAAGYAEYSREYSLFPSNVFSVLLRDSQNKYEISQTGSEPPSSFACPKLSKKKHAGHIQTVILLQAHSKAVLKMMEVQLFP